MILMLTETSLALIINK